MINKRIRNLVEKLVIGSFSPKGELKTKEITETIKILKKLPNTDVISALTLYQKGLKREISKTTLEITSPTKLTLTETNKITSEAKKSYQITNVKTVLDSSLLGGLRIKIGDVVFDDSVKHKIGQMREAING